LFLGFITKKHLVILGFLLILSGSVFIQEIPFRYEEITAPDFVKANKTVPELQNQFFRDAENPI
jgi:hypothetical protein